MNILLLGSGGREHALAWKLSQSSLLSGTQDRFYAAPGNPGIAEHAECVTLDATDHAAVTKFCVDKSIGLVVIGPEAPLVGGLADSLRAADVPVFGPSSAAAQLEGSKAFTKQLCDRANIPTAGYTHARSLAEALAALDRFGAPYVLKADGLAGGKGVVIAETRAAAESALTDMFAGQFGVAGAEVVIEEFMDGEEASFFALTDGTTVVPFGTAQDHKRAYDGDTGPNTGGMGAYSPAPVLTDAIQDDVMRRIVQPTVDTLRAEGMVYSGVLYAGLMLTENGPKLIEYNCRFGDPECQVLMMRLTADLGELMLACANGTLAQCSEARISAMFVEEFALTVVMAAKGYPGQPEKGGEIVLGNAQADGAKVFHAGTRLVGDVVKAAGGRVLNVTASGKTASQAQTAAYAAIAAIDYQSGFYRRDIGYREIAREG